ncbi:hypothetical protein S100390_v1c04940 [Spiroplasma sp. NBRC 100390]|uniref:hypothetical protein n=1 Tax=unclassified Spiroplasma TaxID=2637901 RepID=UPI000892907B|nr:MULTISPECIES: hypothetical protein [unclassified Spiroplasma]AOX43834.1 hypothetical protein STU14_v1c04940 [Spiroplasma sp. TU-14]APE13304.1 hypothetical protein S100390_v1c04940 [Spiroplasma sp. NBRC 100390]
MLQQLKKSIILADILSFIFGFLGVTFGILSVLALETFWSMDSTVRDRQSFALTATTICCDILSVSSAMFAYYYGVKLYKRTKNEDRDDKPEVLKCERYSFYCDFWSFMFGIVGLIFGITSFITLFPSCLNEYTSWWATITSVCFDSVSCAFVGVAMGYFRKGIKLT